MNDPLVTVAVPSLNQGRFLGDALESIFFQDLPLEVVVLDAGSTDESLSVIEQWSSQLLWWRSAPDAGQSAAINEGVARGNAPYVCWLNSDDIFLPGGLAALVSALETSVKSLAVYGRCWTVNETGKRRFPYLTMPFLPGLFASFCFVAQPATLIRRAAWESAGGLDERLHMAMDYDLWWRLYRAGGRLKYLRKFVAATRMHADTKTARRRASHYREAMSVVRRHTGKIPLKWRLAWPFMVGLRSRYGGDGRTSSSI